MPLVDRPAITADDLERLGEALGPDHAPMMWMAAVLGLRWGEAAGMTVGSIDVFRGTVTVAGQLGRDRELALPKSAAGQRKMAAPRWLLGDQAGLLARRGLTGADPSALLFVNGHGDSLPYSPWRRSTLLLACLAAGLPGLRFHALRSNAATALEAAGVDMRTAQTRLGHANPSTTLACTPRRPSEPTRRPPTRCRSSSVPGKVGPRKARN